MQLNRRTQVVLDEAGIVAKFGVSAALYSRLPGARGGQRRRLPGFARLWGESAAAVLSRWRTSRNSPLTARTGKSTPVAGEAVHDVRRRGSTHTCSATWRRCGARSGSSTRSRRCAGPGRGLGLRRWRGGWRHQGWRSGRNGWEVRSKRYEACARRALGGLVLDKAGGQA